ncbi:MAG: hypothetical protein KDB82_10825 [Planctomycetes bacterium]|nr:hypothetical protein [Planctomycetota bacterium]
MRLSRPAFAFLIIALCFGLVRAGEKSAFKPLVNQKGENVGGELTTAGGVTYLFSALSKGRMDGEKLVPLKQPSDIAPGNAPRLERVLGGRAIFRFGNTPGFYVDVKGTLTPLQMDGKDFAAESGVLQFPPDTSIPCFMDHTYGRQGIFVIEDRTVTFTPFPKEVFLPDLVAVEERPLLYSAGNLWFFEDGKFTPVTAAGGAKLRIPAIASIKVVGKLALVKDVTGSDRLFSFDKNEMTPVSIEGDTPKSIHAIGKTAIVIGSKWWKYDGKNFAEYPSPGHLGDGRTGTFFLGDAGLAFVQTKEGDAYYRLDESGAKLIELKIGDETLSPLIGGMFTPFTRGKSILMAGSINGNNVCVTVDENGKCSPLGGSIKSAGIGSEMVGGADGIYASRMTEDGYERMFFYKLK